METRNRHSSGISDVTRAKMLGVMRFQKEFLLAGSSGKHLKLYKTCSNTYYLQTKPRIPKSKREREKKPGAVQVFTYLLVLVMVVVVVFSSKRSNISLRRNLHINSPNRFFHFFFLFVFVLVFHKFFVCFCRTPISPSFSIFQ